MGKSCIVFPITYKHTYTHSPIMNHVAHNAPVFTPGSYNFLRHMLWKWLQHNAASSAASIIMRAAQFLPLPWLSKRLRRRQKCWHTTASSSRAGRHLLMGMVTETLWCCWLLACCARLDSHFLTNLTCVAFCYLARTPCSGRVDYSSNVKEGYCFSFLPLGIREAQWFSSKCFF